MRSLVKLLASGAVTLAMLAPAAAGASTLRVTLEIPGQGVDVSWLQDSNPKPINSDSLHTLVSISGLVSTGTTVISGWTDMSYFPVSNLGGLETPGGAPLTNLAYSLFTTPATQQYSGNEQKPVFGAGSYSGTEFFSGDAATVTFVVVPPVGAPGPVPGAGVAGLAALALAGLYARTRRA
jgi:hypothetical protein